MKKIIALLLALVMCVALVACGETNNNDPVVTDAPAPAGSVEDARTYVFNMYKGRVGTIMRDFEVVGAVTIDGVAYTIEWAVAVTEGNAEDVKVVPADGGNVTVDINEKPTAALAFTLTATAKDAEGKTASVDFLFNVEAVAATGTMYVEQPEYGVPYKFALDQNGLSTPTTLYFTGEKSGNYLAMSDNVLDAVDVVLEETEGGFNITFMDGDVKKYVVITTYTKDDGSLNKTQDITTEPGVPFVWDAERGACVADLGDLGTFYLGTYGTYNTISTSATSYIEDVTKIGVSQFPAGFATVVPTVVEAPVEGVAYLFGLQQNALETPATLYFTGEKSGNYLATSANISDAVRVYLEATEGGYNLVFLKDGVKKYIVITTYTKDDGTLKNTQDITDAPGVPLVWDAERLTFVGDLGEVGTFYFGTYNTYNTISTSATSYIEDVTKIGVSQFPCGFYDLGLPAEDLNPAPVEEPTVPAADSELSIPDALTLAAAADADYTAGKYYITGIITEIKNDTYGNVYIEDAEGNSLYVYGLYDAKGETRFDAMNPQPKVGDSVTIYTVLGAYNGSPQAKNAWVTSIAVSDPVEEPKEEPKEDDEPAEETKDETVVIANGGKFVTGKGYTYTSSSGKSKNELELTEKKSEALVLTVKTLENGNVAFVTEDGKYLMADGTNVELVSKAGENTEFVLEETAGGYFIKCANATYNDKPQYLEVYSGYLTVYGMGSDTSIYTFELQAK